MPPTPLSLLAAMPPRPSRNASNVAKSKIAENAVSDPDEERVTKTKKARTKIADWEEGEEDEGFEQDELTDEDDPSDQDSESLSDLDQSSAAPSPPPPTKPKAKPKPKAKAAPAAAPPAGQSPAAESSTSTAAAPSPAATATTATPSPKKRAKLPPYEMNPETGEPLLDDKGKPIKRIPKPRQKKVAPEPVYGSDGEIIPPPPKQMRAQGL